MNTYIGLLPKELIALCIPLDEPKNFLSIFDEKFAFELFQIAFNINYPDYFKIITFDKLDKKYNINYIWNKLYKFFIEDINNFFYNLIRKYPSSGKLNKMKIFDIYYPIDLINKHKKLYEMIIDSFKNNNIINNKKVLKRISSILLSNHLTSIYDDHKLREYYTNEIGDILKEYITNS